MRGTLPVIERELRRFKRSPLLIIISMIFPIVQLVVLGYAFGGNVRNLKVGVVDQDQRLPAVKLRELCGAIAANAGTFETIQYPDSGTAMTDLRNGIINGVLTIPPDFSKRALANEEPCVALIEDNTDNFVASSLPITHPLSRKGSRGNRRSMWWRFILTYPTCNTSCRAPSSCRFL